MTPIVQTTPMMAAPCFYGSTDEADRIDECLVSHAFDWTFEGARKARSITPSDDIRHRALCWNAELKMLEDCPYANPTPPQLIRHELNVMVIRAEHVNVMTVRAELVEAQESVHISTSSMRADNRIYRAGLITAAVAPATVSGARLACAPWRRSNTTRHAKRSTTTAPTCPSFSKPARKNISPTNTGMARNRMARLIRSDARSKATQSHN